MKKETSGGLSLLSVLQIIFIVLKCVGVIDWSWWKVFIPFWIYMALIVIVIVAAIVLELFD